MNELPYWVQYVQALGPTVVAVIAALIAGYIAWRQWRTAHGQWRTAHDKLSFDLYEKRFAVYEATESFLTTAIVVGRITEEDCKALFKGIRGAEFLFDGGTKDYLMNIRNQAWFAWPKSARQLTDDELTVLKKQSEALEGMFRPYLDLSKAGLTS
jgi:hypothetical protein